MSRTNGNNIRNGDVFAIMMEKSVVGKAVHCWTTAPKVIFSSRLPFGKVELTDGQARARLDVGGVGLTEDTPDVQERAQDPEAHGEYIARKFCASNKSRMNEDFIRLRKLP